MERASLMRASTFEQFLATFLLTVCGVFDFYPRRSLLYSTVDCVLGFRDDALKIETACVLKDDAARVLDVIHIEQRGFPSADELLQPRLAIDQGEATQVVSVQP